MAKKSTSLALAAPATALQLLRTRLRAAVDDGFALAKRVPHRRRQRDLRRRLLDVVVQGKAEARPHRLGALCARAAALQAAVRERWAGRLGAPPGGFLEPVAPRADDYCEQATTRAPSGQPPVAAVEREDKQAT